MNPLNLFLKAFIISELDIVIVKNRKKIKAPFDYPTRLELETEK